VKLFEDFHGRDATEQFDIVLQDMKELVFLGHAAAVEYVAQKHEDKKKHIYRHEFENPAMVLTNGKDIIITGDKIRVTWRGIEG
jgi:hypothetical protein